MKIFASGFAFRLDSLGLDGYAVDSDAVLKAMEQYKERKWEMFEHTLPEFKSTTDAYTSDFYSFKWVAKNTWKYFPGPRKIVPTGGMIEDVFEKLMGEDEIHTLVYILFCDWVTAHANEVVNQIYGTNLPTIESFLLLSDGKINDIIETVYGGHNDPEANAHFAVAKIAEQRALQRELTDEEIKRIRIKFYRTSDSDLQQYKEQFVNEIRDEWSKFMNGTLKELIA